MKRFSILGALLFVGAAATAQDYSTYDSNRDGIMEQQEFDNQYNNKFADWDTDGDEEINDREFYDATYKSVDQNRDNRLSAEEWDKGYNDLYGDFSESDYDQFDANADGYIDNDEYYEGLNNSDYYKSYDTNEDGSIDQKELNQGIYKSMDRDLNGSVDETEFDLGSSYYNFDNN